MEGGGGGGGKFMYIHCSVFHSGQEYLIYLVEHGEEATWIT